MTGTTLGCCLDGFTSQASSSKPPLVLLSGSGGAEAIGVDTDSAWSSIFFSVPFCLKLSASTTSLLWTAGAGRPLRVLFLKVPPGPENSPPPLLLGESGLSLSPDSPFLRLNLLSRYFITLRISPSLRPNVRRTSGVISGRLVSSIESLLKLKVYRSH